MQRSNRDQGREITKDELLQIAPFTKGQLTKIYRYGYLPYPDRRTNPGSNKPVYYWDESIIERAKYLYDLLQWNPSFEGARLRLWLCGFTVEFAPLKQRWLQVFNPDIRSLAQSDADDPLDIITDVVSKLEHKWEHTPTRYLPEPIRQRQFAPFAWAMEMFLSFLFVSDYEQFEWTFGTESDESFLPWLPGLQDALAFPHICEAIEEATPEAWELARQDYISLCQLLRTFAKPLEQEIGIEDLGFYFFPFGGFFLVPIALCIRQRGYGHWIDDGLAWVNNWLSNPDTQSQFTKVHDLLNDPRVCGRLNDPAVRMWFAGQLTEGSG